MRQPELASTPRAELIASCAIKVLWLVPEVAGLVLFAHSLVGAVRDTDDSLYGLGILFAGSGVAWFLLALVSSVLGLTLVRTWLLVTGKILVVTGFMGAPILLAVAVLFGL